MPPDQNPQDRAQWSWSARIIVGVFALALLGSCMGPPMWKDWQAKRQRERAMAMWQERCKKSGEFIHKTVEGVEGVYLVNVRTRTNMGEQPADQFALDDPYGRDLTGEGYITTFVRDSHNWDRKLPLPEGWPPHKGYRFVEANDIETGALSRYTGRVEEPWQRDKSYLKGHLQFVLDRVPIAERTARYGVKFEDISTREEREHWIAGSSLKVINLDTGEVIGERIGYMVDWAQGSRAGARSPWLFAADYACPDFRHDFPEGTGRSVHKDHSQQYQTLRFVEKILKPLN